MLSDLQLINMNGRLYDPYIARFLSPDNYVQLPTSAQSFNRYSYCLNNPLKYTDPSGELFVIDDVLLLTIATNAYTSAVTGAFKASMQGRSVFEGAIRGAGSSLISSIGSMGVGAYFGHGGSTLLNELLRAGAHGIVGGTASFISGDGFAPGFISGSLSSLGTSAVQAIGANSIVGSGVSMGIGALSANLSGGNWMMGAMEGLYSALLNHYGDDDKVYWGGTFNDVVITAKYPHQTINRLAYNAVLKFGHKSEGYLMMFNGFLLVAQFKAVSGSGKPVLYTLPPGNYNINSFVLTKDPKYSRNGIGFKAYIKENPYDEKLNRNRSLLRVHPARYNGTEGCIGLVGNYNELKQAQDLLQYSIMLHKSIPLQVIINGY